MVHLFVNFETQLTENTILGSVAIDLRQFPEFFEVRTKGDSLFFEFGKSVFGLFRIVWSTVLLPEFYKSLYGHLFVNMEKKEYFGVEHSDSLSVPGFDVFLVLGKAFNYEVSVVQGVYFLDQQVYYEPTWYE